MAENESVPSDKMPPTLDFLNYICKLKHLDRAGWVRCGIEKPEPVASHMYRMAVMSAFVIRDPAIDANKCIRLSIVHDMGESIIGDITPHDDVPKTTKAAMEFAAIEKITSLLPGASGEELLNLFVEYEEGKTPEAKIVKHLDRFDMIQQAYEYEQSEKKPKFLQEFFDATATFFDDSHPLIKDLVDKLLAAREANTPFSQ